MLASRVRATELDPSGNTVVLSVLCRSRPPRYKRVTRTSVEESPSQLGRSDNRPLLAIKVALVGVIVVTLSAADGGASLSRTLALKWPAVRSRC